MVYKTSKKVFPLSLSVTLKRGLLLVFILFVFAAPWASAQTCTGSIPEAECQALYALYNSTDGDNWTDNDYWLTSVNVDHWMGVFVEFLDGGWHVTHLTLPNKNLIGSIPPELANLTYLTSLHLGYNHLTGEVPSELGTLANLEYLYLTGNQLTGEIPPELGNLSNLEIFHVAYNQLTGEIPPELANLSNLTTLTLAENHLTGEIPPELGNLSNLEIFQVAYNQLTGEIPPELGSMTNLELLSLWRNFLTGPIPPELGNLTNLRSLYIMGNNFSGDLPDFLADPPEQLDLKWNRLYASDPAVLAAMEDKHEGEFISTQTLTPENISAAVVTDSGDSENRIEVSWDPIAYTADPGGYKVFYRQTGDTEFQYGGITHDKSSSSFRVSNLEPGTEYEFMVNAVTWQHQNNRNDLYSLDSDRASAVSGALARAFIPNWKQAPGYFTGVVAANFGDTDFDVDLAAYDLNGAIEPGGQNHQVINAGKQMSKLGSEVFHRNPYHEDFSWIELSAENSNRMGSIFLFGVSDTQMLDGAEAQSTYAKKLYFTRPLDEGFFAGWGPEIQMCIVNPTDEEVAVNCTIRGSNGESGNTHTIPARGFIKGDSEDLTNPEHGITDGYLEIEVTDGPGVVGFSRIEFPGVRTALGMNAVASSAARTMYSAQLAHGFNIVTNLRLVNTGGRSRTVTLTAVGDTGTPLADPVQVEIESEEIYSADLGTLFGLESEGVINTGSLVVESDGFGIIGDIIFADGETLEYAMSLPLQDKLFQEAVFNHISNLSTIFTGFAFYNPGNASATVLIEAFGIDGTKVAEKTLVLGPGERIARTLMDPDMWPEFPIQSGGYIKIQSDQPIAGQQLFGDTTLRYMAAIPPTTRAEPMFD